MLTRWSPGHWLIALLWGCTASAPRPAPSPPVAPGSAAATRESQPQPPPTAATLAAFQGEPAESRDHPGLLQRQLAAGWGWRNDKDDQVRVPLLDWRGWKRVRYWGVEHLTGFRYGKEFAVATLAVPIELPAETPVETRVCMAAFEERARRQVRRYDVTLGPMHSRRGSWREQPLLIKWVDGKVDSGFRRRQFSAAWAAYPAYDHACLVYAVAVQWETHGGLAKALLARWVDQGFSQMRTLTSTAPYRH